ncbi:ATP-binding cassette domain-containing protein [Pseudobdellovibrio exovorus]|uniref:ABC-type thiamine transport protein, ATP-binding protein n=1 Tax=Pseudobdellovibrio exovorus JSS TaxID=1184267 RepID=M4VSX0_9BACT|nr:ATP-binding cassette domain-containing protein [Pseudobdellovibrio exovorus]AGH96304.1 ABC-type thiamine transport protein, ATP-binding protein [Pseudobdellovibrio exovorus JSS]
MSSIKNLRYKTEDFVLDIPELQLPESGVTAIVGHSGAGKTTLLNILVGLLKPDTDWQWTFKGEDLNKMRMEDRRIGVVFQSYDLFPHLSAEENVLLVLRSRHRGNHYSEAMQKLEVLKKTLSVESCWQTRAQNLSGGEKQRIALLRALMSNPRLLILDEPFSALDPELRAEARSLVKNVISQLEIPVYLITHDQDDVLSMSQQRVILSAGKVSAIEPLKTR